MDRKIWPQQNTKIPTQHIENKLIIYASYRHQVHNKMHVLAIKWTLSDVSPLIKCKYFWPVVKYQGIPIGLQRSCYHGIKQQLLEQHLVTWKQVDWVKYKQIKNYWNVKLICWNSNEQTVVTKGTLKKQIRWIYFTKSGQQFPLIWVTQNVTFWSLKEFIEFEAENTPIFIPFELTN